MLAIWIFACALTLGQCVTNHTHHHHHTHAPHVTTTPKPTLDPLSNEGRIQKLEDTVENMARQLMLQQLAREERIRTDGQSGVKRIRLVKEGTSPYNSPSYTLDRILSIHEHSNYDRTVGMGEFVAVLNGNEFRTRHNDYKLRMPSKTSTAYNAMQDIPFPEVPHSVSSKHTVAEQIAEMKEYFKAWKYQNNAHRPYKDYFKPVLCYLEGAWTADTKSLNEPFASDRHHVDASSWFDLQEKVRYTSYTGGKSVLENYSYLPTTVMSITNGSLDFAQWNYRILCHPLKENLPLGLLKPVDDIAARMNHKYSLRQFAKTRGARFHLPAQFSAHPNYDADVGYGDFPEKTYNYGLLDRLMYEIPGKNNYGANLNDHSFGDTVLDPRTSNDTALNTGFYHRVYKSGAKGAMGIKSVHRGFADEFLFTAQTTQPRIAEMSVHNCRKDRTSHKNVCRTDSSRYSYAIPLEIIYLTPLYKWNPYNLPNWDHLPKRGSSSIVGDHFTRNGGHSPEKAYNGTNYKYYYYTPAEFYSGTTSGSHDRADTDKGGVGVLDRQGNVQVVMAAGTHVMLPEIDGVGRLRTRYPIVPVHQDGTALGKNVAALTELLNHMPTYASTFTQHPSSVQASQTATSGHFATSYTHRDPPGFHRHEVYVTPSDMAELAKGNKVTVTTTTDNTHEHDLEISFNNSTQKYTITHCDALPACWDGHTHDLFVMH